MGPTIPPEDLRPTTLTQGLLHTIELRKIPHGSPSLEEYASSIRPRLSRVIVSGHSVALSLHEVVAYLSRTRRPTQAQLRAVRILLASLEEVVSSFPDRRSPHHL